MPMSSPLILRAGVIDVRMILIGSLPDGAYANMTSSSSPSSLDVSSWVCSSVSASSGYRPRSVSERGVRGRSEQDARRRWNWASDLTSLSTGRASSATRSCIRGNFTCGGGG